jgi:hypothetical protein
MKSKFRKFHFPALGHYVVHVEITSDIAKSLLKYPRTRKVEMDETTNGLAVHTNEGFSYIFLPYNASVGNIAHEAWHVVRQMMEYLGIKIDNEAVAYHLGYLTNRVWDFVHGRK